MPHSSWVWLHRLRFGWWVRLGSELELKLTLQFSETILCFYWEGSPAFQNKLVQWKKSSTLALSLLPSYPRKSLCSNTHVHTHIPLEKKRNYATLGCTILYHVETQIASIPQCWCPLIYSTLSWWTFRLFPAFLEISQTPCQQLSHTFTRAGITKFKIFVSLIVKMLSCFKIHFFSYEWCNAFFVWFTVIYISFFVNCHAIFLLHCWPFSYRSVSDLAVTETSLLPHVSDIFP